MERNEHPRFSREAEEPTEPINLRPRETFGEVWNLSAVTQFKVLTVSSAFSAEGHDSGYYSALLYSLAKLYFLRDHHPVDFSPHSLLNAKARRGGPLQTSLPRNIKPSIGSTLDEESIDQHGQPVAARNRRMVAIHR